METSPISICWLTTGSIQWASSRLRGFWIAECRDNWTAIQAKNGTKIPEADVYVFAKFIDIELIKYLRNHAHRIYLDICDPIHWFSPDSTREVLQYVDGIVASNQGLANDFGQWSDRQISVIPDRLKLSHYNYKRQHADVSPVRFIWYGASQNRAALMPGLIFMDRLEANGYPVELTIVDDAPGRGLYARPSKSPVYHLEWMLHQEARTLANHDIALLPPYPGEWGKVKSNNKILTAWAAGLPVVTNQQYKNVVALVDDWEHRQIDAMVGYEILERDYQIEQSAVEWEMMVS